MGFLPVQEVHLLWTFTCLKTVWERAEELSWPGILLEQYEHEWEHEEVAKWATWL